MLLKPVLEKLWDSLCRPCHLSLLSSKSYLRCCTTVPSRMSNILPRIRSQYLKHQFRIPHQIGLLAGPRSIARQFQKTIRTDGLSAGHLPFLKLLNEAKSFGSRSSKMATAGYFPSTEFLLGTLSIPSLLLWLHKLNDGLLSILRIVVQILKVAVWARGGPSQVDE